VGIETTTYRLLQQIKPKDKTCLCLGYSDLLVDPALIGGEYTELEDADKIRSWHNWPHPVYDTTEVLTSELGFRKVDYVDIVQARGPERIVDLNYPADWSEKYDVVIDGGTAEHCFNIGQVFANILSAVRPDGGVVVHVNPLNMMNHGFWNISPTAYADFYRDNGFEMLGGCGVTGPVSGRQVVPYDKTHLYGRFQFEQPVEVTNIMAFRRTTKVDGPVIWPMQSKYR
jgi:hypothetical protein